MLRRKLLLSKPSNCFACIEPLKFLFRIDRSPICYVSERFHHFNCNTISIPESPERRITLNPQFVQSTLANCPSDLVSLNFFLWCARQRNYFHDRYAFSQMVSVLSRLVKRFESIDGVVKELERIGCVTRPQTFLHMIRVCWLGGMYGLIFDALDTMGRYGYTANTFASNVVMDISFRTGETDIALNVLRENGAPNFLSFNIALCHLCKLNDLVNMRAVLQNMLMAGFYPNVETFVKILKCLCDMGLLREAFEVLGLMVSLGIHVCVVIWNIMIDGVCKLGRPDVANCMLEKMISAGCSPNVMTYTSLVKGYLDSEQVVDAFRILGIMESRGCKADVVLCNVLISCLSKLRLYDEALEVFHDLRKRKLEPDAYTFSSLVSTVCSSGKFHLLTKLLGCFDCPADLVLLNSLLSYFCKAGFPVSAVNFFRDLEDRGFPLDKYSYAGLLTGLCRSGKIDEAVNLYNGMVIEGFELDAHIHTLIISELNRAREYQKAFSLFRKAEHEQYHLDSVSYAVAVQGLVRSRRVQEAYSLYTKMKGLGFVPGAHTANIVLSGFCKERDLKMVKQLLSEMFDSQVELYYGSCIKVLTAVNESRQYLPVFNMLILMVDSGLLLQEAIRLLVDDGLRHGIRVDDLQDKLLRISSGDNSCADTSGSEDLIELAA